MRSWVAIAASCSMLLGCHDFDALVSEVPRDASDDRGMDAMPDAMRDIRIAPSHIDDPVALYENDPDSLESRLLVALDTDTAAVSRCTSVVNEDSCTTTLITLHREEQDQFPGRDISVWVVDSLEIEPGQHWFVTGGRPLAIVSLGPVIIDGTLDLNANDETPGPGGSDATPGAFANCQAPDVVRGSAGCGVGDDAEAPFTFVSGGGGGGNGTRGGAGGDVELVNEDKIAGGVAGIAIDVVAQSFLLGGGAGGVGASMAATGSARGGHGGGAIQITSNVSISVGLTGIIVANGGNGRVSAMAGGGSGGGGGGAGGLIYLEAPELSIEGKVFAHGGGGGGGDADAATMPEALPYENLLEATVVGSDGVGTYADKGGNGAGIALATKGKGVDGVPAEARAAAGGGGGGHGRIVLRSDDPDDEHEEAVVLSPSPKREQVDRIGD